MPYTIRHHSSSIRQMLTEFTSFSKYFYRLMFVEYRVVYRIVETVFPFSHWRFNALKFEHLSLKIIINLLLTAANMLLHFLSADADKMRYRYRSSKNTGVSSPKR